MKEENIITKDYCQRCKSIDNLRPNSKRTNLSGVTFIYHLCKDCYNANKRSNYHKNPQGQLEANKRYLAKKKKALK